MSRAHPRPKGRTPAASSPRGSMDEKDAAFIAAANPATILKLLAVVKALRDVVAQYNINEGDFGAMERAHQVLKELETP